jgi:hypothetical protein
MNSPPKSQIKPEIRIFSFKDKKTKRFVKSYKTRFNDLLL